jgi:hypothetical protein
MRQACVTKTYRLAYREQFLQSYRKAESALPESTGPTGKQSARKRARSVWSGGKAAKPYLSLPWLTSKEQRFRSVSMPLGLSQFPQPLRGYSQSDQACWEST